MPKTWFQHDMNSTQKDGLSALIANGGFSAYGRFWAFMELFYSMQINREEFKDTININEKTLLKQLQMNRRSLPKLLQLFRETLGIVFQKNCETYGIVYKTTAPNSMIYLKTRIQKKTSIGIGKGIGIGKKKGKGKDKGKLFSPPTLEDVSKYIQEKEYDISPMKWFNHYTANGWMVGKNKMKDWKAAIRTWLPDKKKEVHYDFN